MATVASSVLILLGVGFAVLAGVGLHRFPDVFSRMHAASKPATFGLVLILVGAILRVDTVGDATKLALAILLQFATVAVGSHMVARAAYRSGTVELADTVIDELGPTRPPTGEGTG